VISSHLLAMVEDICSHVLVLCMGHQRFWGPLDQLRSAFAEDPGQASLEEVFFRATAEFDAPDARFVPMVSATS
jgi:ABC-2 type transport system ATP-binding protein